MRHKWCIKGTRRLKETPPLQQQSKRGLQQKSGLQPGPTGPETGLSGAQLGQPVANRGSPAHDPVGRSPTGLFTRTQQIRLPTGQPAYGPASPAHGPVDRSPTGRQPEELQDQQKASGHWSGLTGLTTGLSGLWPGQTGFLEAFSSPTVIFSLGL